MGKNKNTIKPRTMSVTMDMGEPMTANGYSYDPKTGKVALLNNGKELKPKYVTVEQSYERKKGRKILNQIETCPDKLFSNPNKILQQYDIIFSIDTNTKYINSNKISVTGIVYGEHIIENNNQCVLVRYRPINCLEFRNVTCKAENLGWKEAIKGICNSPHYTTDQNIALVVDSDLGNLKAFNSKEMPIVGEYYLPKNFTLVYASADAGSENIANTMLKVSDQISNVILKRIKEENSSVGLSKSVNNYFSHMRIWEQNV